jgi:hypothetical protein
MVSRTSKRVLRQVLDEFVYIDFHATHLSASVCIEQTPQRLLTVVQST